MESEIMTVREVIEKLSMPGNTLETTAREINGVSKKTLQRALELYGYQYSNKGKRGWHYVSTRDENLILDRDIEEVFYKGSYSFSDPSNKNTKEPISLTISRDVKENDINHSQEVNSMGPLDSHRSEIQFTIEELAALKGFVGEYLNEKQHQTKRGILHKRIMNLEKTDKVRKTIVISDTVGEKLDEFAASTRFNKSDLLEIAILDLINRYE